MGLNEATHITNIFLHVYEKTFFLKLKDNHQDELIGKLGDMFRYQDDLIVIGMQQPRRNIGVHNIYPKEMIIEYQPFTKYKLLTWTLKLPLRIIIMFLNLLIKGLKFSYS